uniref:Uncharacterized protein n=1 Tax=Anguilla anguilla TaxID=7936 RepID=A0A0E9QSL0_ANGAN
MNAKRKDSNASAAAVLGQSGVIRFTLFTPSSLKPHNRCAR